MKNYDIPKDCYRVRVIDGIQFIFDQNGNKVPFQKMTRVTQTLEGSQQKIAEALVKLIVVLEDTK